MVWVRLFVGFMVMGRIASIVFMGSSDFDINNINEIEFVVRSSPEIKFDDYKNIEYQLLWFEYNTDRVGLKINRWPELNLGDKIRLLDVNNKKLIESSRLFGINKQIWIVDVAKVSINRGEGVWYLLNEVRQRFSSLYRITLPYTLAGLLSAMVYGEKRGLSKEIVDQLRWSGLSHVVVVSGFNIMMIYTYISKIFTKLLGLRRSILLSIIFVWTFVLFVGVDPPVLRAAIFISLVSLGTVYGRVIIIKRVFWVTILVMFLINPYVLFSISWQLSICAMAGLIWFSDRNKELWESKMGRHFGKFKSYSVYKVVEESIVSTLSASIAVLPVLIWHFGTFSVISLISNLFVLWLIPIITIYGLLVGIIGLVVFRIAVVLLQFILIPLQYFKIVVEVFGQSFFAPEISEVTRYLLLIIWLLGIYLIFYKARSSV